MKTKTWSLTTRISHWLLAIGFTVAYITGENEWQMNYHYAFGALVGGILFFRILYGIIGPKYSNFKDFPMGISQQIDFIKNYFSKNHTYVGHNPLASLVMFSMMFLGIFTAFTGYLWATESAHFLGFTFTEEMVEESHEIGAKLFLILVFAHLAGIFADTIFHRKTGTLGSIFTGYKNVQAEAAKTNAFHKIFSIVWLGVPMILFYLAFGLPVNERGNERENEEEDEWESLLYPDKNSEKSPMNLLVKLTKNRSNVDGTSSASSSRQTDTNNTVNTETNSVQSYAQNSPYYTENNNDEHEYYEHEEHSKHHHEKREHHDYEDGDDD